MKLAILGTGFISRFYAESLVAQRRKDELIMVCGRDKERVKQFAADYNIPHYTTDLKEAVSHPDVELVIIGTANYVHLEAVLACAAAKKHVICTKPLGRNAHEALQMLKAVDAAGITGGYLEDLCYTPKFLKSLAAIKGGSIGEVIWAKSRETHPGPHSDWFWDKEKAGGGAMIDLGCHCVEISRNFIGKDIRPVEVMCWADTRMHPIDAEDNAVALVKYANGAIGQFADSHGHVDMVVNQIHIAVRQDEPDVDVRKCGQEFCNDRQYVQTSKHDWRSHDQLAFGRAEFTGGFSLRVIHLFKDAACCGDISDASVC